MPLLRELLSILFSKKKTLFTIFAEKLDFVDDVKHSGVFCI